MTRYASETTVPVSKTKTEIEQTLLRYGAKQFLYGWQGDMAVVAFQAHGRRIQFTLPMPSADDLSIRLTPTRQKRSAAQIKTALERAERQRWRALLLIIKAKLEAVESGIVSFEEEFLPYTALPSGQTVSQWLDPQVDEVYATGQMPPMLPGAPTKAIEG